MSTPTATPHGVENAMPDVRCDVGRESLWAHLAACPNPPTHMLGVHACDGLEPRWLLTCTEHLDAAREQTMWPVVCGCGTVMAAFAQWAPIVRSVT